MINELQRMEEYAIQNNIPIMQLDGVMFLKRIIQENSVKRILEIGSAIGYSAIQMCLVDESIQVTTIERDTDRYLEAVKNVRQCEMDERISVIHGDALETVIDGTYDLLFIDAAKAQYIKFFERYINNVSDQGIIISDNLKFHGMVDTNERINNRNTRQLVNKIKKYISYLEENNQYNTTFYDIGDGIAVSKRKTSD